MGKIVQRNEIQKKLLEMIIDSPKREKWLIFVHTRKEGRKLKKKIEATLKERGDANRSVGFISSDYRRDEKMQKIVITIVNEEKYKESILISTAVIDTGVTISCSRVRNIVINTFLEDDFKQLLGRRRVREGETINLFICGDLAYLKKCRKSMYDSFCKALPVIAKESHEIRDAILRRNVIWGKP